GQVPRRRAARSCCVAHSGGVCSMQIRLFCNVSGVDVLRLRHYRIPSACAGQGGWCGMAKKKDAEVPALEAPNAGELDVLNVLCREPLGDDQALQLSEIHRRVCERRRLFGEPEPALTTTSSQLRSLSEKRLIGGEAAPATPRPIVRTRGGYTPPSRASA